MRKDWRSERSSNGMSSPIESTSWSPSPSILAQKSWSWSLPAGSSTMPDMSGRVSSSSSLSFPVCFDPDLVGRGGRPSRLLFDLGARSAVPLESRVLVEALFCLGLALGLRSPLGFEEEPRPFFLFPLASLSLRFPFAPLPKETDPVIFPTTSSSKSSFFFTPVDHCSSLSRNRSVHYRMKSHKQERAKRSLALVFSSRALLKTNMYRARARESNRKRER